MKPSMNGVLVFLVSVLLVLSGCKGSETTLEKKETEKSVQSEEQSGEELQTYERVQAILDLDLDSALKLKLEPERLKEVGAIDLHPYMGSDKKQRVLLFVFEYASSQEAASHDEVLKIKLVEWDLLYNIHLAHNGELVLAAGTEENLSLDDATRQIIEGYLAKFEQ